METRFYRTQEINIPAIAQALELEYQAQGYEAQQFGDVNQTTVQLKKESTLRAITGFDKVTRDFLPACRRWAARESRSAGLGRSDCSRSGWSGPPSSADYSSNRSYAAKYGLTRCAQFD